MDQGGGSIGPEENKYCVECSFGRVVDIEDIESIFIGHSQIEVMIK